MKAFLSLYITNLFLVGGTGLLTTFLALYMGKQGEDTAWIGLLTSCYYIGLLLGARLGYRLISSVGHIRCFAASTAIVIACVAGHGISDNLYLWLVLRLLVGVAMMSNFMVLESWLNEQTEPDKRGRIFSIYMITSYIGMVVGQYALSWFQQLDAAALFLVCMAISIGIVPISTTRKLHPKPLKPLQINVLGYFRKVPQSLTAILFAGIFNGSFYGLAPLYVSRSGFVADEIALFMSVTVLAGLIAQWPMGLLSDRLHRSPLIRFNTVMIGLISLMLFLVTPDKNLLLILTFVFGLFAFTLYPLASALANSRVDDDDRVGVSSALLVVFGVGAGIGSLIIAQLMSALGHTMLYGSIAFLTAVMFVVLSIINNKQKAEKPAPSDYVVSASDITTSPLAASMDPRIEESTAQDQLMVTDEEEEQKAPAS